MEMNSIANAPSMRGRRGFDERSHDGRCFVLGTKAPWLMLAALQAQAERAGHHL